MQREGLGFSSSELAAVARIAQERLSAIESGQSPTTWEVFVLADALAVDAGALWRGDLSKNATRSTVRFRSAMGTARIRPDDARTLAKAAEMGRIVAHLKAQLGDSPSPVLSVRGVLAVEGYPEPWEQGYRLGAKARALLFPAKEPIQSFEQLLETLGIIVLRVQLDKGIEAASLCEPDAAPVIMLNVNAGRVGSKLSRRAVLAHELCHILHDGGEHDLLTLVSQHRAHEPFEQRANGFAPSFIVPGGWLPMPDGGDAQEFVLRIAIEWGLSFEGAAWHAKNATRISPAECYELIDRAKNMPELVADDAFEPAIRHRDSAAYGLDIEPSPLAGGLVTDVTLRAFEADLISEKRAKEILSIQ